MGYKESSIQALVLPKAEQEEMIGYLQDLIQMPSPTTQERAVAGLIKEKLRAIGIEHVFIDEIGNVIAQIGSGEAPVFLIDAHMDTVMLSEEQSWTHDPFAADIDNGSVVGLGACDVKGPIAALIYAVKRLIDTNTPLNGTLFLVFVVQQEPCEGCALKAILEREGITPDWVLLCEPSDLQIMLGHRGRVMMEVNVQGKSSHASNPLLGKNAISAAARLIFNIEMMAGNLGHDTYLGDGTITVTHIESHAASMNAIPDRCSFYVDRRLTLGETPARAQAEIEAIIDRESIDAAVEVVSYTGFGYATPLCFNPWQLPESDPLVHVVQTAIKAVHDQAPLIGHWSFSTDGVYTMGERNIPTIGFGPGNPDHVHSSNEQVKIKDVIQASHIYALIISTLLSGKNAQY